jgi:hypothetical protein
MWACAGRAGDAEERTGTRQRPACSGSILAIGLLSEGWSIEERAPKKPIGERDSNRGYAEQ